MNSPKLNQKVVCADGFSMSVQANATAYSMPKMTGAPVYTEVEIGFPSAKEELLMAWCDEPDDPTGTVYGYVPAQVVVNVIAKHGGMVEGDVPAGIPVLRASSR